MPVLSGRIFKVKDVAALVPILLGDIPPLWGYAAWSGVTVTATCYVELGIFGELPIASFGATTAGDGSYSLSVDVPNPFQGLPVSVAITISSGVLRPRPAGQDQFRKAEFLAVPVPRAQLRRHHRRIDKWRALQGRQSAIEH